MTVHNRGYRNRKRVAILFNEPSQTHQSFKDECDINNVMAKFEKTGTVEHIRENAGVYADLTEMPQDYHEALEQVRESQKAFDALPAKVRAYFNNDPGEFLDFASDKDAIKLMRDHGLIKPEDDEPLVEKPAVQAKPEGDAAQKSEK